MPHLSAKQADGQDPSSRNGVGRPRLLLRGQLSDCNKIKYRKKKIVRGTTINIFRTIFQRASLHTYIYQSLHQLLLAVSDGCCKEGSDCTAFQMQTMRSPSFLFIPLPIDSSDNRKTSLVALARPKKAWSKASFLPN